MATGYSRAKTKYSSLTAVLRNQGRRFFAFTQTYNDLQGHGSRLEGDLPCLVCFFKAHMIYIS